MRPLTTSTLLLLLLVTTQSVEAQCTRPQILSSLSKYLSAQTSGDPSILPLPSSSPTTLTYIENNLELSPQEGILSTPHTITYNHTLADIEQCAGFVMWIAVDTPRVVAAQVWLAAPPSTDDEEQEESDLQFLEIDAISATTGDLFFDAALTQSYLESQDWSPYPSPPSSPSSSPVTTRESLTQIADLYLDMWTSPEAADLIPWGPQCERVEGSSYTSPCGETLPRGGSTTENSMRRYVVDVEIGAVDVLCEFTSLGPWPDSHEIRVDGEGMVRYVDTVTVM